MSNRTLLQNWRQRWNHSLLRFIGRRVPAGVDVEDLAQETYLRLLRARDLHDVRNPQGYLLKVASHIVTEWRERQLPPGAVEGVEVDANLPTCENQPGLELEAEVSQAALNRAIDALPPLTRAVMLLKYRDNRSCKDIATQLELTDRQVRRHITRGLEQLRGELVD